MMRHRGFDSKIVFCLLAASRFAGAQLPTTSPTFDFPTTSPTPSPSTAEPSTAVPTSGPTPAPSTSPSSQPSSQPSPQPTTADPSPQPTPSPTTADPSPQPTALPTPVPTTAVPSPRPTTAEPTVEPTRDPCWPCPPTGFECIEGPTATLMLLDGYMRMSEKSLEPLKCEVPKSCKGGLEDNGDIRTGCDVDRGHSNGPYCSRCESGYFKDAEASRCRKCTGFKTSATYKLTLAGYIAGFLGFICLIVASARESTASPKMDKWKVAFVALQIATSLPRVLDEVVYPASYATWVRVLGVFELLPYATLPASCLFGASFYSSLILMTAGPVALFILALMVDAAGKKRSMTRCAVIVSYLVVAPVSTTIFRIWDCEHLDTSRDQYLRADGTLRCSGPNYDAYKLYAVLMAVVYTAGIPALYCVLIFKEQSLLLSGGMKRRYWEVAVTVKRLAMGPLLLPLGPFSQALASLLTALLAMHLGFSAAPFADAADASLNGAVDLTLVLLCLATVAVMTDAYEDEIMGRVMVAMYVLGVLFYLALARPFSNQKNPRVYKDTDTHDDEQRRREEQQYSLEDVDVEDDSTTKGGDDADIPTPVFSPRPLDTPKKRPPMEQSEETDALLIAAAAADLQQQQRNMGGECSSARSSKTGTPTTGGPPQVVTLEVDGTNSSPEPTENTPSGIEMPLMPLLSVDSFASARTTSDESVVSNLPPTSPPPLSPSLSVTSSTPSSPGKSRPYLGRGWMASAVSDSQRLVQQQQGDSTRSASARPAGDSTRSSSARPASVAAPSGYSTYKEL